MPSPRTQFNLAVAMAMGLALAPATGLAGPPCNGVRGGSVALIGGTFAGAEAVAVLTQHSKWWTTPTTGFSMNWGGSASKGQDALLHASIGYHVSQISARAWEWACVRPVPAAWLGAALGFAAELPKEIGDGVHRNKGFSGTDMTWAAIGATLPALRRTWSPAAVLGLKGNYWPSREYLDRTGSLPQLETDYAGQRYFLAVDPGRAPGGAGAWPDWLGLAVGHGIPQWVTAPPTHDWYVTLDLNARGLPIRARWWRSVAWVIDQVKIPLPGLRIRRGALGAGVF